MSKLGRGDAAVFRLPEKGLTAAGIATIAAACEALYGAELGVRVDSGCGEMVVSLPLSTEAVR